MIILKYAWLESHLVIDDKEFLSLLHDLKKESKNAGITQKDLNQAVATVRKKAKTTVKYTQARSK